MDTVDFACLKAMRTGENKAIEREGLRIAMGYLVRRGLRPKDVSDEHRGYDILVGKRRIEVKASTTRRGWNDVDIRKTCALSWRRPNMDVRIVRRGLPFDEIIEVVSVGSRKPQIFHYPATVIRRYGEFHLSLMWHVQLSEEQRKRFMVR